MENSTFRVDENDNSFWHLFKEGLTKGIFQLESNLGRTWCKKLCPESIEELAALIALIRPGPLKGKIDGKSMTQRYVDRKNKLEQITYIHDSLEDILKTTYGVLVYQEQAMLIAVKLAGFNEQEADNLRKAIGKKKADLMMEIREQFISGCEKVGLVDKKTAVEIFSWIEKSARYQFNKSHSVAYAIASCRSAWYKANHTKEFFASYLYHAEEKQDPHQEIYELISEAKIFDIEVKLPKLSKFSDKFAIMDDGIYFGIKDIKSLAGVSGDKVIAAISEASQKIEKAPVDFSWLDILIYLSPHINSTAFKALCSIGFFSTKSSGVSRNKALYEYGSFKMLTKTELAWVESQYVANKWENLTECFKKLAPSKKSGGGTSSPNRNQVILTEVSMLEDPPYELTDDPAWIVEMEKKFLGCPVSLSKIDAADSSMANTTCKDIVNGKTGKNICVVANVVRLSNHKIRKNGSKQDGRIMCFLTIEDTSCAFDGVVIFPDIRDKYQYILYEGSNLMFCGEVSKDGSFVVENIHEI